MAKWKFNGPRNPHDAMTNSIIVNGETIAVGQEFTATKTLVEPLTDRYDIEEVEESDKKTVTVEAPTARHESSAKTPE